MNPPRLHRILFVHAAPGIPVGGVAGGAVHIREVVRAMVRAGHDVLLVARRGSRRSGEPLPVLPCPLKLLPQGTLPGVLQRIPQVDETVYDHRLSRFLRSEASTYEPTLVYERFSLFSLAGANLARHAGVPFVLEVNAPLARERSRHEGLQEGGFTRRREEKILAAADRVVAVSTALGDYLRRRGVPADHIRCIPNGVDVHRFRPGLATTGGDGDDPRAFRIGFCGTLKPWHDLGTVLRALATSDALGAATLLVVGDGPSAPALRRLAEELGVGPRITWAGARAEDEVPRLLAGCDVLCVPSPADPEHYFSPLKLFEGMALGLPVVATDVGDVARVSGGDEPAALLVPPEDPVALGSALARIAGDRSLGRRLGGAGRARAVGHTWDDVVRESLEGL